MKKNLRIVSAAAAALLAVAPVAATAFTAAPVNAAVAIKKDTLATGDINLSLKKGQDLKDANTLSALKLDAEARIRNQVANSINMNPSDIVITVTNWSAVINNGAQVTYTVSTPNNTTWKTGEVKGADGKQIGNYRWNNSLEMVTARDAATAATATAAHFTATVNFKPYNNDSSSASIDAGNSSIFDNTAVNTTIALNAVAQSKDGQVAGALNGNLAVTLDGKSYTALLHADKGENNTLVWYKLPNNAGWSTQTVQAMQPNTPYVAEIQHATVALDNKYAGQTVTINLPQGSWFGKANLAESKKSRTKQVKVNANGVADLGMISTKFYAYDASNMEGINFFSVKTGEVVKSGSVDLHAVNGNLNVESVYHAISAEYAADQLRDHNLDRHVFFVDDIKAQLEKQNIQVDPNGYFKAPASFSLNMTAKSNTNGATASLPVTVNVDNVTPTAAQETTKTVKIMHIATIYDKNGKATHEPALRAYNTVSVVSDPVSLKDEKGNDAGKFYKLAGKDQYIKVGNVDGTSRSLKHNSYVYKSTGKRRGKTVLKKGSSVTTYGKSFMIAGHQMYRIGENQYVKKANF